MGGISSAIAGISEIWNTAKKEKFDIKLYWARPDKLGEKITEAVLGEKICAVAVVSRNVSSVVFNICYGNMNPKASERRMSNAGTVVYPWISPAAGTYRFYLNDNDKLRSDDIVIKVDPRKEFEKKYYGSSFES